MHRLITLPILAQTGRGKVPVGTHPAEDVTQVLPEVGGGRTTPEPVAVVDFVDDEARLQHKRMGNHGVVKRVGVLSNIQVLLYLTTGVRKKCPLRPYS